MLIDVVLTELLGIRLDPDDNYRPRPGRCRAPRDWSDWRVENLHVRGRRYDVHARRQDGGDAPADTFRGIPVPRAHQGGFARWQGFEFRNNPFDTWYFVDDNPEPRRIVGYQTDGLFDLALSVEPPHPPYQGPR